MLEEDEYALLLELYQSCAKNCFEKRPGATLSDFQEVREAYARLGGDLNTHHNAIMHHRQALLGPDCLTCGKPLRTPKARFCAACGRARP